MEAGGAVGGAETADKIATKVAFEIATIDAVKVAIQKAATKIATKRVVSNTTAAREDHAAGQIESTASSGTSACVRLVGHRIADWSE